MTERLHTSISPMLAVPNGPEAIEFYKKAFAATVRWLLDDGRVGGLLVDGAPFFLRQDMTPTNIENGPRVLIELFVEDPVAWQRRAIEAGATERWPVEEHHHPMTGPEPWDRMLQGGVEDPFGHVWLIGRPL